MTGNRRHEREPTGAVRMILLLHAIDYSFVTCFRNYATFSGRAGRSEFWYFVLFLALNATILGVLGVIIGGGDLGAFTMVGSLFALVTFLPWLAVAVRRLHDIDLRGWWLLLAVTGIGALPLIVMLSWPPTRHDNRFGP